jgi:hypothetical protein
MTVDRSHLTGFRASILRDVLPSPTFDDAVALVGLVYEFRFVFSRKLWSFLQDLQKAKSVVDGLEPLEPHSAATFVGDLYAMDCDALFLAFHRDWSRIKASPRFQAYIAIIEMHDYIDRLEKWTPAE